MIRRAGTPQVNRSRTGNVGVFLFLLIGGSFMALPMVYAIVNSFKPLNELWYFPPRFFVEHPTGRNYVELFRMMSNSTVPFLRYVFNTFFITIVGTFGHILLSSMCAYSLSKHHFYGRKLMFQTVVTALMFNSMVVQIPSYLIITKLGMADSYLGYIIPAFGMPLGLYLMKQFIEQIVPDTVLEAARIDGAGEFCIFWRLVMPMVRPAWLTLLINCFQSMWNIGSTTFVFKEQLKTLNYALSQIMAGGIVRAGVGAAASVITMIVPVVLFLLVQSNVVETMATSGMKE